MKMSIWTYKGKVVDELPDDCEAFVYLITNTTNNRKYVGKKLAKFKVTRPPLKGKKRKRKVSLAIDPKTKSENYKPRGHYWIDPDHVPYFRKHQTAADYNAHFNDELICARAYKSAPDIKTQKKAILEEPISEEVLFGNDDVPF